MDLWTDRAEAALDVAIVTGPAGAGRSTAIRALEDLGFEAIDNLPLDLLMRLLAGDRPERPLAVGIDARTRDFDAAGLLQAVRSLRADRHLNAALIYLDCDTGTLLRRFSETRRRHPMAPHETPLVGVDREHAILAPLAEGADILLDTTEMTPHDLRAEIARRFGGGDGDLAVHAVSFSYKRGLPRSADMVLDCRFLRNPHWSEALRPLTGLTEEVAQYVAADPRFADFAAHVLQMLTTLLPAYAAEGKAYFTVAFGCTGGRHRSVYMTHHVANKLADKGWQVSTRHRELERAPAASAGGTVVTL
ncbi:MAG: RNase adapter RapZ [Pseudomonadota bacterium]